MPSTHALLWTWLAGLTVVLSACGGATGGSPANGPQPSQSPGLVSPPAAGPGVGSVTVHVTTSAGTPLPGIEVVLNGGFDGLIAVTDAAGYARFADLPASDAHASVWARGYHAADSRLVVTPDTDTDLTLILEQATAATPVVLGTHAVPASDGMSLTVDVDIAVLDENGRAIQTLTAAEFSVSGSDCAFMWCVSDETGYPLLTGGYAANVAAAGFSWHSSAAPSSPPMSAALLLEQDSVMADFDPDRLRLGAVNAFLESVMPPGTVSPASYRGKPPEPVLTTYGPFTSDAAQFRAVIDGLAGQEAGQNPLYEALTDMLRFTAEHAPGGTDDPARALVLVAGGGSWPDDGCLVGWTCAHEARLAVATSARALGFPIVAIGGSEPAADIAARTGGAFVAVNDPLQYRVVLGSLGPVVGRTLDYNRVRIVLDSGAVYGPLDEPVFASGHTVWAFMSVRVGPSTSIWFPVVIPIE